MANDGPPSARSAAPEREGEPGPIERLVAALPPIVFELDLAGTFVVAAGRGLEDLGLRPDLLVGQTVFDLEGDSPGLAEAFRHAAAGERHRALVPIGGRRYECSCQPRVDAAGRIDGVRGVLVDASDHVATIEALQRSEASFRALIESAPDGILVHRFGRIVFLNPAVASLLRHPAPSDLLGRPYLDLFPAGERAAASAQLRSASEGERSMVETRLERADGTSGDFELTVTPLVFDGEPAVATIARDVTERQRMRRQIDRAERLASLGTLAGGVSHEINNPLAAMLANLAFLGEELTDLLPRATSSLHAEVHDALSDVRDGAERVREIVRQLSEFGRVEDGVRQLEVRGVVDQAVRLSWNQLRRRARLRVDYRGGGEVEADPVRLGQVFFNLLVNAAQATEPVGEVRVDCRLEGDVVAVTIADDGPGIPDDVAASIFDPFFSTRPVGQGTGLGLSVAHSIVRGLGGTIALDTEPGRGSAFTVRLPLTAREEPPAQGGPRRPVVVVEDEIKSLASIQACFRDHLVILSGSGAEAVRLLAAQPAAAVVADTAIADASPEAIATAAGDAPVLFLVSNTSTRGTLPGRILGKPFDPRELAELAAAIGLG